MLVCCLAMSYIDTSMMYHLIKSQSIIKLYIFYNMLEVGDRLFSAFGQDTIDALLWTATEPRGRKREHFGLVAHLLFAAIYVFLHSLLVLFQVRHFSLHSCAAIVMNFFSGDHFECGYQLKQQGPSHYYDVK